MNLCEGTKWKTDNKRKKQRNLKQNIYIRTLEEGEGKKREKKKRKVEIISQ